MLKQSIGGTWVNVKKSTWALRVVTILDRSILTTYTTMVVVQRIVAVFPTTENTSAQSDLVKYGRGLGSQYYLTCLHASCNVATFNVWLFNAWYSCFNSSLTLLHSISSFCNLASVHLTFVLRPCRIFIVQCVMPFFVLPLFILSPAIILTSSCHHCFVYANCTISQSRAFPASRNSLHGEARGDRLANCNYTYRWRFTRRWSLKVEVRVRVGEKTSWEF